MTFSWPTNEYQTPITDELLSQYPDEVVEQLYDCLQNIELINWLVSPNRPKAKDCPHDEKGRVIVDLAHPHIIEDMDYFRQPALHFMKHNCYTMLKEDRAPQSAYMKFWKEEKRRCLEGYVRESDGEWVTGFCYWFMNYNPMMVNKIVGKKKALRIESFPDFWEGIYLRFHYLYQARDNGKHAIELARRGCAKSYSLSSIMTHNLELGEDIDATKRIVTVLTAYEKEYLSDSKEGTLSKFKPSINFIWSNTPFPRLTLKNSPNDMTWQMGYKDEMNIERGSLNQVLAVSAKDNPDKLRGKRGWVLFEEMGSFKGLLALYDTTRKGVEDGNYAFATMYLVGTSAEKESDFTSAKTLLYGPDAYNILSIPNVYDKKGQGRSHFGYFFPSYMNRLGCYNKDGVSDVVKALLEVLLARYKAKYSADPKSVLRVIAEDPITPAEAIIKVKSSYFPVVQLNERIQQLDTNPASYDDVYVGNLLLNKEGEVVFKPSNDTPIRQWGEKVEGQGAIEIFEMPEKDRNGNVYGSRYIIGHDPVDNDQSSSDSLSSTIVFDLFTDKIVAEFTGRKDFANDNFEIVRLLCIFYNAKCLFEAHPYDQLVRLPDGTSKLWGDIKIGDELFAPDGTTTKVVDIPIDGEDDIYELTLQDGRKVQASSNHIWSCYTYTSRNVLKNFTTKQMFDIGVRNKYNQSIFFLPEANSVNYAHKDVPLDAYTLGVLISEGAFTKIHKKGNFKQSNKKRNYIQFSASNEDGESYKEFIPYEIKHIGNKGCSWHLYKDDLRSDLESLGLIGCYSYQKFIPNDYLYNDYETRLELLKGLMDSDGCAISNGASVFVTTSKQLADDIVLLCRSLGIKANHNKGTKARKQIQNGVEVNCRESYRIAIHAHIPIFKLPRKSQKQHMYNANARGSKARAFINRNAITNIEHIGKKQCKCVTVDREDGLYLIGDYVVTHNCNKKGMFAYFSTMKCTHYLAETPEYLREKQLVKYASYGSNKYGVNATAPINDYANSLIRDWLLKPTPIVVNGDNGEELETTVPTLMTIRNRALLDELVNFNPVVNVDRIRSLGMVMLLREEKIILYQGDMSRTKQEEDKDYLGNDPFFNVNIYTNDSSNQNS